MNQEKWFRRHTNPDIETKVHEKADGFLAVLAVVGENLRSRGFTDAEQARRGLDKQVSQKYPEHNCAKEQCGEWTKSEL